jgi:DNA replication initiation complex subunit (GINS family)
MNHGLTRIDTDLYTAVQQSLEKLTNQQSWQQIWQNLQYAAKNHEFTLVFTIFGVVVFFGWKMFLKS